jgi:hypothetical protein
MQVECRFSERNGWRARWRGDGRRWEEGGRKEGLGRASTKMEMRPCGCAASESA